MKKSMKLSLIMILALLVGCSDRPTSKNQTDAVLDNTTLPDSEVRGAKIYLYEGGRVTTEILADRILKFDSIDSTMAYTLDITFFDTTGGVASTLVGDSGIIREQTSFFKVYGHVIIITGEKKIETDSLVWNPEVGSIRTDAFVKITQPERVLTGWGLDANRDLSRARILRGVSGRISDVEKLTDSL